MSKVLNFPARRRPESATRTYVTRDGAPFVNREAVNPPPAPAKPHPVHQAARALALSRMATAVLSRCQKREALLKSASMLATCPHMRQVWQTKADQIALSILGDFDALPDYEAIPGGDLAGVEFAAIVPPVAKKYSLWPWLMVGLCVALAITVTPPFWVS